MFLGFSYEKSQGGNEATTEYIISTRDKDGTFRCRKYTKQKNYDAAVKKNNEYQKEQNGGE